ncbi:MAG: molybdenum cofactor biosynthesis protein MoaE [Actinomycetota bacterium]
MKPIILSGLTADPIDVGALVQQIRREDCGGLVVFEGSTRTPSENGEPVTRLDYEAYESRASEQLNALAGQAAQRFALGGVIAIHRTGPVPAGSPSVVVAAAAPHRAEAFEAARWLIDTLKAEVSIWKKEVREGGEAWVQ